MFYVGRRGSLVGPAHFSPLGGMTLCGILSPTRDRKGHEWWRQEYTTDSIRDVLDRVALEKEVTDETRLCGNCLRIAELHPHRLLADRA